MARPNLFLKIFLCFWLTVIATAIAVVITFIVEPRGVPSQWHATLTDTAQYSGMIAAGMYEQGGEPSAAAYIERIAQETHLKACLLDATANAIAGNDCDSFRDMTMHVAASKASSFNMKYGIARVALAVKGHGGRDYIFATELPAGPRAAVGIRRGAAALQWGVALLVSGLLCYLLTRYLTTPILQLRKASQQLAGGNLSTRAASTISLRKDELGDLVRDFNSMATRIEDLVSRQRLLISDVSHELRSPLARLNVALDLGRERKGSDPAFDHMEEDLGLLDEMIGRLLTIAKLDMSAPQVSMTNVDITALISQVVRNAEFESRESSGGVQMIVEQKCFVHGNAELLQSAIENVVRNAIRYTEAGTSVEVSLTCDGSSARLMVRDFGPGVPEAELSRIFEPFYRVKDARDRQSGGAGLGLAIADRVIRIHGGTIRAENVAPRGLQIEMVLPQHRDGMASIPH